ncbi:MAG TPA: DUF6491 family protein [Rhizomicrobium sp.]|nr:DUF6491 family protein [Rhizomicrobium sp.]
MRKLLLAFCGLALLAATPGLAKDSPTCIRRNDIRSWGSPARRTLILENYAHQKVLLRMNGTCSGFGPYDSFQITGTLRAAASCIAVGDTVLTHWAGEPGRCQITAIEAYDGPVQPKSVPPASY